MHLDLLIQILTENGKEHPYPCIKDLVRNGLKLERFSDEPYPPSRQDITQYIASWCKYMGISADDCRKWMIEYCVNMLSVLSSSSNSRIRHSTKSNIKYIYSSDVSFECKREKNRFRAECDPACPAYKKMEYVRTEKKLPNMNRPSETTTGLKGYMDVPTLGLSVKEIYREQFEKAMTLVQDRIAHGISKKEIVTILNERGLKTRTGKKWSYGTLGNELRSLKAEHK